MSTTLRDHHGHGHSHEVAHPHPHHEAGAPPAGGPVVVDIGGDVGALLVTTDPAWLGRELHVRRDGEVRTTHTGVWERTIGSMPTVVAVFPALVAGRYDLLDATGQPMRSLAIAGGRITGLDLRQ